MATQKEKLKEPLPSWGAKRIQQFDAAITRIAHHVHACCGGVDTENEIDSKTGEPYGPGGHTAVEIIRKFDEKVAEAEHYKDGLIQIRNALAKSSHDFSLTVTTIDEHLAEIKK